MTSKQRAYLRSLAMTMDPIFQIGKSSLTPEFTAAINEVLEARELVKISVLKNCMDEPKELATVLAERTHSEVVQVIGKKIVLYKESKNKKKIESLQNRNKELRQQITALENTTIIGMVRDGGWTIDEVAQLLQYIKEQNTPYQNTEPKEETE